MTAPLNGLSVDVEDWWHLLGTPDNDDPSDWGRRAGVMEAGTDAALELFDEQGVRATFFFLGWAARHGPSSCAASRTPGTSSACTATSTASSAG